MEHPWKNTLIWLNGNQSMGKMTFLNMRFLGTCSVKSSAADGMNYNKFDSTPTETPDFRRAAGKFLLFNEMPWVVWWCLLCKSWLLSDPWGDYNSHQGWKPTKNWCMAWRFPKWEYPQKKKKTWVSIKKHGPILDDLGDPPWLRKPPYLSSRFVSKRKDQVIPSGPPRYWGRYKMAMQPGPSHVKK